MNRRSVTTTAAAAALLLALGRKAYAQRFPEQPITMIVAFPPGGGTDVAARTLALFMERELGQSIVVHNRAGAGGELGWAQLARARPDGYTIGFINTPQIVTIPIERQAQFRLDNFLPLANVVDDPGAYFVHADSPLRNLADLVTYARANPERVSYGTTGIGSDDHLATLAFSRLAGLRLTHVPFSGAAQVRAAVLGQHITLAAMNIGEGLADMQQGQLRALGMMAPARWELAPNVPTFREQGYDVVQGSMRGIAAPAGVPAQRVAQLATAIQRAMNNPEFRRLAVQQSLPLRFLGPEEYRAALLALQEDYQRLWSQHPWRD